MRRETRARWLAAATAVTVVVLAALFAVLRNASDAEPRSAAATALAGDRVSVGQVALERLGCIACHSVGGRGNPTNSLDGVGRRRDATALREWTLGQGTAKGRLPPEVVRMKARAADDPDLPALMDYLATLR